eukprot:Gb_22564 [translate_table: standard]
MQPMYCTWQGTTNVITTIEIDLKKIELKVIEEAKEFCQSRLGIEFEIEMVEGDVRNVLCEAVEKHKAEILVVGSDGYGTIKR